MNFWTACVYVDIDTGEVLTKKQYEQYRTLRTETEFKTANNICKRTVTRYGRRTISEQLKLKL